MAKCSVCGKDIGIFSRTYKCVYCGRTLCKNCITELEASGEILDTYRLLGLPYAGVLGDCNFITTRRDVACSTCAVKFQTEVDKIFDALCSTEEVELLPSTYHGRRNVVGDGIEIESRWHKDWKCCDDELVAQAHYYDCDCVMKIERERETESECVHEGKGKGSSDRYYYYSVWKKSGIAYKLKK